MESAIEPLPVCVSSSCPTPILYIVGMDNSNSPLKNLFGWSLQVAVNSVSHSPSSAPWPPVSSNGIGGSSLLGGSLGIVAPSVFPPPFPAGSRAG